MNFNPSMVEGDYLHDIIGQPEALAATIEALAAAAVPAFSAGDRIVLTGMGASYHALHPLYIDLVQQGRHVLKLETAELLHDFSALLRPPALVIAASQSGRSAEIVRLLQISRGQVPIIGVTNTPDSPLATQSVAAVLTRAGIESSVSCKTYVTTLAALDWLGAALFGDRSPVENAWRDAPGLAALYLSDWQQKVASMVDLLAGTRMLFVAGRGRSMAAASAGGLILKESAHFPAEGMTCPAFRHGPFELTGPATAVLIFHGETSTAPLNLALAADIRQAGGKAFVIGPDCEYDAFRIPATTAAVRPALEILPVQLVSLALAALSGHTPGKFRLLAKVTTVE